jgi:hypothetical protein
MRPIEAAGDSGQWPLRHQWRITSTAESRILGVQRHNAQSLVPCFLQSQNCQTVPACLLNNLLTSYSLGVEFALYLGPAPAPALEEGSKTD